MGEEYAYPHLSEAMQENFRKEGKKFCYVEYYNTRHQLDPTALLEFLYVCFDSKVFSCFEKWAEKIVVPKIEARLVYHDGSHMMNSHRANGILFGNYLAIGSGYDLDGERAAAKSLVRKAVSLVRLFYGETYGEHLHFFGDFITETPGNMVEIRSEDLGIRNDWLAHDVAAAGEQQITDYFRPNDRALQLLYLADDQSDLGAKYLLLWTSLEAQLSNFSGDNGGTRRKNFCKKDLGSEIISDELYRLFQIRNAVFKDVVADLVEPDDVYRLKCIIRLAMTPKSPWRGALASEFIKYLKLKIPKKQKETNITVQVPLVFHVNESLKKDGSAQSKP